MFRLRIDENTNPVRCARLAPLAHRAYRALLFPNARDPENIDLLYGMFWTRDDKDYPHSLLVIR